MNKLTVVSVVVLIGAIIAGCATTSPEEKRAAYQKEYSRLASLPPAQMVVSPNYDVANCAKLSCDLFGEVQPMMKAYVAKTESSREYTGFMNDVQYYVKEEKMSNQDACKKVADAVIAADANRPDDQKVWPKIQKGIVAANELDPKTQLAQIALLVARNLEIAKSVKALPNSLAKEDFMSKAQRLQEISAISKQLTDMLECLYFLQDQYTRVVELEAYARN